MPGGSGNERAARSGLWRAIAGVLRWWVVGPLALLIGYVIALAYTEAVVRGKLDEIRARGEPLRLAEMAPKLPLGADNAADAYLQAFGFLPQGVDMERAIKEIAYARSLRPQFEPAVELLREASGIPTCAFPVNWNAPAMALTFPHYARMRESARLLNAHARVLAADGKYDDSLGDIAVMYRMAEHVKSDPTLIGLLVAYAIQGITLDGLEAVLSAGDASPEACRRLFDQLGEIDHRGAVRRAFLAERAVGVATFEAFRAGDSATVQSFMNSITGGPDWPAVGYASYRTFGRPVLNLDEALYLDYMNGQLGALDVGASSASGRGAPQAAGEPALGLLGAMLAPVMDRTLLSAQRREAEVAVARAALALNDYNAERRRYPQSLTELSADGWQLPTDPFGGADLRYRKEKQGFVVYSLGPNLADDGGAEWQPKPGMSWEDGPYDIVFRCER